MSVGGFIAETEIGLNEVEWMLDKRKTIGNEVMVGNAKKENASSNCSSSRLGASLRKFELEKCEDSIQSEE